MPLAAKIVLCWIATIVVWVYVYLAYKFRGAPAYMWSYIVTITGWLMVMGSSATDNQTGATIVFVGGMLMMLGGPGVHEGTRMRSHASLKNSSESREMKSFGSRSAR